jgi:hypothetical protein
MSSVAIDIDSEILLTALALAALDQGSSFTPVLPQAHM